MAACRHRHHRGPTCLYVLGHLGEHASAAHFWETGFYLRQRTFGVATITGEELKAFAVEAK